MSLVRFRSEAPYADLAHLVERDLAKVEVAGSSPVIRSNKRQKEELKLFLFSLSKGRRRPQRENLRRLADLIPSIFIKIQKNLDKALLQV